MNGFPKRFPTGFPHFFYGVHLHRPNVYPHCPMELRSLLYPRVDNVLRDSFKEAIHNNLELFSRERCNIPMGEE